MKKIFGLISSIISIATIFLAFLKITGQINASWGKICIPLGIELLMTYVCFSTWLTIDYIKRKKHTRSFFTTPKGIIISAAIESGLIPEVERDGIKGYDLTNFENFWWSFSSECLKNRPSSEEVKKYRLFV